MPLLHLLNATLLVGCVKSTYDVVEQRRELATESATFDAGTVAVGDRQTIAVFLQSMGKGAVTVFDVRIEEVIEGPEDAWVVLPNWKEGITESSDPTDTDDDGVDDAVLIDGGSEEDPSYGQIDVSFRPSQPGYYRAVLVIESNDNEVTARTDDDHGLWRVVVRGMAAHPCGVVYPQFHDFGPSAAGGYYPANVTIENCGVVQLTVADYDNDASSTFYLSTSTPLYVGVGDRADLEIGWEPANTHVDSTEIVFDTNDPDFRGSVTVLGNDCTASVLPDWDQDDDGYTRCNDYDCDDTDPDISPAAQERADGIDNDCDGEIDEEADLRSVDDDADGYSEADGDCDDDDDDISPDAAESLNGKDDDCDGVIDEGSEWYDDDNDGMAEREGDCDDTNALVHPGASETNNGRDDNCNGNIDEGTSTFDDDGDGLAEIVNDSLEEGDCNDADPWVFPGAKEDCDDVDNDCDSMKDEGEDGTEDGACAFLVDRVAYVPPEDPSCSSLGTRSAAPLALFGVLLGQARRRRKGAG